MLEMECTNLTPRVVLETSGHVEKFTDMMVKDDVTGECKRADHLLEDAIDELIDGNVRKAPPPPRLFFRGSVEAACVSHYVFSALFFPLKQPEMSQAEKDEHRLVQRQADSYSIEEMQRLFTEFNIIINLSVLNYHDLSIIRIDRLVTSFTQIQNRKAPIA